MAKYDLISHGKKYCFRRRQSTPLCSLKKEECTITFKHQILPKDLSSCERLSSDVQNAMWEYFAKNISTNIYRNV